MRSVHITLIGKPECHLCDGARATIRASRQALESRGISTEVTELDILQDVELEGMYREDIPVVLIDGKRHSFWRVDPVRFEAAVERRARRRMR